MLLTNSVVSSTFCMVIIIYLPHSKSVSLLINRITYLMLDFSPYTVSKSCQPVCFFEVLNKNCGKPVYNMRM